MPVMQPSTFQPAVDDHQCTGFGGSVRACPVQAISLVPRKGARQGDSDKAAARLCATWTATAASAAASASGRVTRTP